ncbi:MAG: hypothetical protein FGM40_07380 [Rhodocyclaceae bacterium]|nr:hypothetical protein [Rhodocyclaceae bacterium]
MALLAAIALVGPAAGAMPADDLRKAKDSAEMVARKSAQYELCGVPNANDLRKSLLDFGQRCGAEAADLDLIGKAYDSKRGEQMKALVNGNYVCPVQPSQAREMIARDLVAIGAVDCKPTKSKLQLK